MECLLEAELSILIHHLISPLPPPSLSFHLLHSTHMYICVHAYLTCNDIVLDDSEGGVLPVGQLALQLVQLPPHLCQLLLTHTPLTAI